MSTWYLRKADGSVFGPADTPELKEWAADGRVAPDDQISTDRKTWQPAPSLADLNMCWSIVLEGGEVFGPLHALALCDLVEQGSVSADSPVQNAKTGETLEVRQVLLPALIAERSRLQAAFKEKEEAWTMLLQKERQIALGRETDLRQKLEKARQMQAALGESLKKIEQGMKGSATAAASGAVQDPEATERLKRLEKELGEVKAELDLERRRLREEKEEWQRRAKRRDEEKARLEEEIKALRARLAAVAGGRPVEEPLRRGEPVSERPAGGMAEGPKGSEEAVAGDSVGQVIKAAAERLKAQAAAQKKAPPGVGRAGRKSISANHIRRGPMRLG